MPHTPDTHTPFRRTIPIRTRLVLSFLLMFTLTIGAMLAILSRRVPEYFDEISRERVMLALTGIRSDYESLINNTQIQARTIAQDQSMIEDIASVTMLSTTDTGAGHFIERIVTIRDTTGLDILKIVSASDALLIADGADPAHFGSSYHNDPTFLEVTRTGIPRILIKQETIQGRHTVTAMVYQPIKYRDETMAVLLAAKRIGEDYIQRLQRLTSSRVVLLVGTTPTASSESGDPAAALPVSPAFLSSIAANSRVTTHVRSGNKKFMVGGIPLRPPRSPEILGYILIGVPRGQLTNILRKTKADAILVILTGLALSLFLSIIMSIGITRPIGRLVRFAHKIGRGEFDASPPPIKSHDEIGLLTATLQTTAHDLLSYREKLVYTERTAAWSDIARRMAHEIKNPLSPIQLAMENLKATHTDNPAAFDKFFPTCADTVLEEVDKLRRLANEFSEFARLPKPQFEDVEISEILTSIITFTTTTTPPHITIHYHHDDAPLTIRADRDQINRVFTNLIKNAIESLPNSSGSISISLRKRHGEIFAIFEDSGSGISPEIIDNIFTPYFTTKTAGTGLGLPIVKRILSDHNASIDVYSQPNKGTTFTIIFKELKTPPRGAPHTP